MCREIKSISICGEEFVPVVGVMRVQVALLESKRHSSFANLLPVFVNQ